MNSKIFKKTLFLILASIVATTGCAKQHSLSSTKQTETAFIHCSIKHHTAYFATSELKTFLAALDGIEIVNNAAAADWTFELLIDTDMAPYSFGYECDGVPNRTITIKGPDTTCMLHGVYTVLEDLGYVFDVTGPVCPQTIDFNNLVQNAQIITPFVKTRGIGEHINFPMDVSSYPIGEAKEFIRNLARMRFNYITFHSYPNQWIEKTTEGKRRLAGSFFYGQRHDVPDDKLLQKVIHNKDTYCIPAVEPYFEDKPRRSRLAVQWLGELMRECDRAGMKIGLSFEPRRTDKNIENTLITAKAAIDLYPLIDRLEIRTQEFGGWGADFDPEKAKAMAIDHFGKDVFDNNQDLTDSISSGKYGFDSFLGEIGHNIIAVEELKRLYREENDPEIVYGVYCTVPKSLNAVLPIIRNHLASDIPLAFIPGHGAWRTFGNLKKINFTADDLKRTQFHSWVEFDGIMYLQQNCVEGLKDVLQKIQSKIGQPTIPSAVYFLWHHSDCRTSLRYASVSGIDGMIPADDFYQDYGTKLRIEDMESYTQGMKALSQGDKMATASGNLGFCFVGVWGGGLGLYGWFDFENLKTIQQQYETSLSYLQAAERKSQDPAAKEYLSYLDNRIRYTLSYLKGQNKGFQLRYIVGKSKPEDLTKEQKKQVVQTCDEGLAYMQQAMDIFSEAIIDRGGEGHLISLYYTPVAVLKRIRYEYGGVGTDIPPHAETIDAPPPPVD